MADGRTVGTVHVIDLEEAGSALAPRAGIAVGREDTLSRVHRIAVWSVCMRVKSASSHSSTSVTLTHGTAPGSAAGGTWLQPSSRSARARDPSNACMHIERLSARGSGVQGEGDAGTAPHAPWATSVEHWARIVREAAQIIG